MYYQYICFLISVQGSDILKYYEGCSNMNASSFITFFTYMLRQNCIPFWKELFITFKMAPNIKKHLPSALDKLLGQLGIYATWLSSLAYLQKQLRIFIFFTPRFFFCDFTFSYCMKQSGMCLHIYSLPLSAFLKYQTRGFYCT